MKTCLSALLVGLIAAAPLGAQDRTPSAGITDQTQPSSAKPNDPAVPGIPLKVQIVISRWDGDRRVSNQPYTLIVNAIPPSDLSNLRSDQLSRLRIGAEVPVSGPAAPADGSQLPGTGAAAPVQYRPIGTNIDCTARVAADKRFMLQIAIEDSSVYASDTRQPGMMTSISRPIFRTFRIQNTAVLADGQSIQFTTAADKIGGDVVKVDVSVNVLK